MSTSDNRELELLFDFDVDIDLAHRQSALQVLPHTPASIHNGDSVAKHNTGVYFQSIPRDPNTGLSALDYKDAQEQGFFKVDFLNNTVYRDVRSNQHLDKLANTQPDWSLLQHEEIVETLYHIGNHYDIVSAYEPSSVMELAMILALIRPAKRHLVGKTWSEIEPEIWTAPTNGEYHFKKAHAVAFATVIVVQLNLLAGL